MAPLLDEPDPQPRIGFVAVRLDDLREQLFGLRELAGLKCTLCHRVFPGHAGGLGARRGNTGRQGEAGRQQDQQRQGNPWKDPAERAGRRSQETLRSNCEPIEMPRTAAVPALSSTVLWARRTAARRSGCSDCRIAITRCRRSRKTTSMA